MRRMISNVSLTKKQIDKQFIYRNYYFYNSTLIVDRHRKRELAELMIFLLIITIFGHFMLLWYSH